MCAMIQHVPIKVSTTNNDGIPRLGDVFLFCTPHQVSPTKHKCVSWDPMGEKLTLPTTPWSPLPMGGELPLHRML